LPSGDLRNTSLFPWLPSRVALGQTDAEEAFRLFGFKSDLEVINNLSGRTVILDKAKIFIYLEWTDGCR